eukprot:4406685-Prymnesium_polylepis.1
MWSRHTPDAAELALRRAQLADQEAQCWAQGGDDAAMFEQQQQKRGLGARIASAQESAEAVLIRNKAAGSLCNLTTHWGCEWSNRHRQSLLVVAGLLILAAFTVQKGAFLGVFLLPDLLQRFAWVQYDARSSVPLSLMFIEGRLNFSDPADANLTRAVLDRGDAFVTMRGGVWG